VTPSTHRILNKESIEIDGKEKLVNKKDTHIVFVRPKAFVDSSGTTWANETMRLRNIHPSEFEVDGESSKYSDGLRGFVGEVHDNVKYFQMTTVQGDWERCKPGESDNQYTKYEISRFKHIFQRLEATLTCVVTSATETNIVSDIKHHVLRLQHSLKDGVTFLMEAKGNFTKEGLFNELLQHIQTVIDHIGQIAVPAIKPRWADVTDAGPGVGVSNFEVKFRDAEMSIIHNSDYRVRIHNSRDGSGDNEAERTNSAIGDSIVDGATLPWEKYPKFHNLSDDDISHLTLNDFEELEAQRMEKNAWYVTNELKDRIDGAPVFNEYISAYTTEKSDCAFFLSKELLKDYQSSRGEKQKQVSGCHHMKNIIDFIEKHYHIGELFMEYIKGGCVESDKVCEHCEANPWVSPPMTRIPQPVPSATNIGQYEDVFEIPSDVEREIDDFAPRAQLKKLFKKHDLSSKDHETISSFSQQYSVDTEAVAAYVRHMEEMKFTCDIKARERAKLKAEAKCKAYEDFSWDALISTNDISKLTIPQLRIYLEKHGLSKIGNKKYKIERIKAHFYMPVATAKQLRMSVTIPDKSSSESSSDEDEVIRVIDQCESSSGTECEEMEESNVSIQKTRSGRKAGSWKNCFKYQWY
jgi:hypothetical protein